MSDMGITRNDCIAVHTAVLMKDINDDVPISDHLMDPFMVAAKGFKGDKLNALQAIEDATISVSKIAFAGACGATEDEITAKAEIVKTEVSRGFKARGWHCES